MIVSTTPTLEGRPVKTYHGIVAGEAIVGANVVRDFFASITDVIGGQVDYMIDVMPNTAPQVKGGKLQALAVSTAKRVPGFDNVPTIAESGVAGFEVGAWDAIFAPKGTFY